MLPSLFRSSLAFCGAAQFLDAWTTDRALLVAGTIEANPVAAWLMSEFGAYWAFPKYAMGAAAMFAAYRLYDFQPSRTTTAIGFTIAKVYAIVLLNNYFAFV